MSDGSEADERFLRTLGKRRTAPVGSPPSAAARAAMTAMAQYRTGAPKGVFIYSSHEAANRDWVEWQTRGMLANGRGPAPPSRPPAKSDG